MTTDETSSLRNTIGKLGDKITALEDRLKELEGVTNIKNLQEHYNTERRLRAIESLVSDLQGAEGKQDKVLEALQIIEKITNTDPLILRAKPPF